MIKSIIVAVADNGVIGKDNSLVWQLPADMRHFKNTTIGHHVIMGRKTFESFKKPLKERTNIVITRNTDYQPDGCIVVHSLQDALSFSEKNGQEEVFILGGAEIYRQSLDLTDRIYLTEVHETFDGDTFFPDFDRSQWKEIHRENHDADEKNPHPFSFVLLERKAN
jgi:dihydrofolate reductase